MLSHLEGTSPVESAGRLKEHLENCSECAAEVAGWQRTIQKLENYKWPRPEPVRPAFSGVMLKWAAAAVFVLGIGFGIGRLSEPSAVRLKQAIATEVRDQIREELKADLLAALATSGSGPTDFFQQQLRREFADAINSTVNQTGHGKQRLVQEIQQAVQQRQDENQRILVALLQQVREEHQADYISLRHDLETAAYVADNDLKQNRQRLSQLAATLLAKSQD